MPPDWKSPDGAQTTATGYQLQAALGEIAEEFHHKISLALDNLGFMQNRAFRA